MSKLLEPIFSKADLHYCSVPVPDIEAHKGSQFSFTTEQIAAYGQGQTHPSIVYIEGGWNGHEYWMAITPYPKAEDVFENPCIYYGDADENGNPPRIFHPINGTANGEYTMINNPIVKVTSNKDVNSDPDLWFDPEGNNGNGVLYMISRWNGEPYGKYPTYVQQSIDGQSWTPRPTTPLVDGDVTFGTAQPSLLKVGNEFRIYGSSGGYQLRTDTSAIGNGCSGMGITAGSSLDQPFTFKKYCYFGGKRNIDPYHSDVFVDPKTGKFYVIFCAANYNIDENQTRRLVYLAESEDGENFHVFARPLLGSYDTGMAYYRPTACVRNSDRKIIVYWCTVSGCSKDAADYPNGDSDVPVDSRAVGVSYGDFDAILSVLRNDRVTI